MPFDSTTFRQPKVTVLPPQGPLEPPERGGGPRRIRIEIEIIDRRALKPPPNNFWAAPLWLLLFLLLAALAHAQPTSWESHRDGFMTRYQGTDRDGRSWSGTSYKQGFTTYSDFAGPDGQMQRCRSWKQGWQTFTECDR
jgi:hypothetical protein